MFAERLDFGHNFWDRQGRNKQLHPSSAANSISTSNSNTTVILIVYYSIAILWVRHWRSPRGRRRPLRGAEERCSALNFGLVVQDSGELRIVCIIIIISSSSSSICTIMLFVLLLLLLLFRGTSQPQTEGVQTFSLWRLFSPRGRGCFLGGEYKLQ